MTRELTRFINETRLRSPVLWKLILIQALFILVSLIPINFNPRTIENDGIPSRWGNP